MSEICSKLWQDLLQTLTDPAVIGGIGSVVLALMTLCSSAIKKYLTAKLKALKKKIVSFHHPEHIMDVHYCATSMLIQEQISKLRAILDCSRVAILQFRNGTLFTLSAPMFRVYCSYESLRHGVKSSCSDFSERIGTTILEFLGPLLSNQVQIAGVRRVEFCELAGKSCPRSANGFDILKFESDQMPYCEFQCMLKAAGIRVLYAVLLRSGTNPIGVLTMHYLVEHDADKLVQPHACKVCEVAHTVQTLLDARITN